MSQLKYFPLNGISKSALIPSYREEISLRKLIFEEKDNYRETTNKLLFKALELKDIFADINIQPHDINDIHMRAQGRDKDLQYLCLYEENGKAVIATNTGPIISSNCTYSSHYINGRQRISGYRTIILENGQRLTTECVSLLFKVPVATYLRILNVRGKVEIGEIAGNLFCDLSGITEIISASAKSVKVKINGTGSLLIQEMEGDAELQVKGTGKITIAKGEIPNLEAYLKGTGSIKINALVGNANLYLKGTGDIFVNQIKNRSIIQQKGLGKICIGS